jgi:hypothetical protein
MAEVMQMSFFFGDNPSPVSVEVVAKNMSAKHEDLVESLKEMYKLYTQYMNLDSSDIVTIDQLRDDILDVKEQLYSLKKDHNLALPLEYYMPTLSEFFKPRSKKGLQYAS